MTYRLKNISKEDFSFEGVFIKAGEVSEPLSLEVYQRLLALYEGWKLVPYEEKEEERKVEVKAEEEKEEKVEVKVEKKKGRKSTASKGKSKK